MQGYTLLADSFLNIKQNESIVYVYVEEQPISKLTCLLYARFKTVRFMKLSVNKVLTITFVLIL